MLDTPSEILNLMDLAECASDQKLREYAYRLLSSMLARHGMRWDWFV